MVFGYRSAVCTLMVAGFILIICGIRFSKYKRNSFMKVKRKITLDGIADSRMIRPVISMLVGSRSGFLYRFTKKIISRGESVISVEALYFIKCCMVLLTVILLILIRYTNIEAAIMHSKISEIGAAYSVLEGSIHDILLRSGLLRLTDIVFILTAFWLPEIFLILRRLLLNNCYKWEITRLENVFELLGSIKNFKTINVIEEMGRVSNVYKRHLAQCHEKYLTDKESALEKLKESVKVARFKKMVDCMRIYAFVNKSAAMEILKRNRLQREEEMFITAGEDVDLMDILAFISIMPVVLQLAELMLRPMMDTVINSFNFI